MIKKITSLLAGLCLVLTASVSQVTVPAPSPSASFSQDLGLITISGEYSRPGVKGRTIFAANGLVPYGEVWRTGANAATKITFSGDVKVEGQELGAGSYAILTIPNANQWKVHFYPYESANFNSYVEKEPALIATVVPQTLPFSIHNFTIMIGGTITHNSAVLDFIWDTTLVPLNITVDTDAAVLSSIENTLSGPSPGDYFAAATYYHETGKDLNKALKWVQMATHTENPRFWQVRREALILADLGKKEEAVKAAKKSLKLAKEAGNEDYVRMNEKSIKEWTM